jgi:hypothetical protein
MQKLKKDNKIHSPYDLTNVQNLIYTWINNNKPYSTIFWEVYQLLEEYAAPIFNIER